MKQLAMYSELHRLKTVKENNGGVGYSVWLNPNNQRIAISLVVPEDNYESVFDYMKEKYPDLQHVGEVTSPLIDDLGNFVSL